MTCRDTRIRAHRAIEFLERMREENKSNRGVVDSIDNRIGPIKMYLRQMDRYIVAPDSLLDTLNALIDGEIKEGYLSGFED